MTLTPQATGALTLTPQATGALTLTPQATGALTLTPQATSALTCEVIVKDKNTVILMKPKLKPQLSADSCIIPCLTHLPRVPHICIGKLGQHWSREWLVACL